MTMRPAAHRPISPYRQMADSPHGPCLSCGTTDGHYYGRGLCNRCGRRARNRGTSARYPDCGRVPVPYAPLRDRQGGDPRDGRKVWLATPSGDQLRLIANDAGTRPYHAGLQPRHRANWQAAARAGFLLAAMDVAEARGVLLVPTTTREIAA